MKRFVMPCILLIMCFTINTVYAFAEKKGEEKSGSFYIMLDPGHGGQQSGAEISVDGKIVSEKDINLKIALYLKTKLLEYENVEVGMTREEDETVDLEERSCHAAEEKADVLISIHNNAKGACCEYENGCTVLVSKGQYKEELAQQEQELGVNILHELSELGLTNQGLLLRTSENNETYPNGELADYYALVRAGINSGIPAIIIEHAFLDHEEDYKQYLKDEEKLEQLAQADAKGIARCFRLKKKSGECLSPLSNIEEKLVLVKDGIAAHNEVSSKIFYRKKEKAFAAKVRGEDRANVTAVAQKESLWKKVCEMILEIIK